MNTWTFHQSYIIDAGRPEVEKSREAQTTGVLTAFFEKFREMSVGHLCRAIRMNATAIYA